MSFSAMYSSKKTKTKALGVNCVTNFGSMIEDSFLASGQKIGRIIIVEQNRWSLLMTEIYSKHPKAHEGAGAAVAP